MKMKLNWNDRFKMGFVILLVTAAPLVAGAQVCGGTSMVGSTLQYIVRDAKGVAIDAGQTDLQVAKSDSPGDWAISGKDFVGAYEGKWNIKAPDAITALVGKVGVVKTGSTPGCNFAAAQTLQLTLGGKSMRLIFLTPHLPKYQSGEFLVDSIPFQEGIFSIDLPTVPDGEPKFYEATGWKKITAAEESIIQAEARMWTHDYAKAVENWKRAATLNPGNPKIPRLLGYSYIETKQSDLALSTLQEAVRLNPKSAMTRNSLAQAFRLNGKEKESAEALALALDLASSDPECDEEWTKGAQADLKRSLTKLDANQPAANDAKGWLVDGVMHFKAEMYNESTARFEQAHKLDPKNVKVLKWLGLSYQMIDKDADGIGAFKEAVRLDPNDAEAQGLLGEAYLYSKLYQNAVDSLTEAVRLAPNTKDWQDSLKKAQQALSPLPTATATAKTTSAARENL